MRRTKTKRWAGAVDELEGRALLSTTTGSSVWSNPAVQADLAKIQADQKTLIADTKAAAPTIQKDEQAIQTAIQNAIANDASVQSATATLNTDQTAAQATLSKDWKAIVSASSISAAIAAAKVYWADATSAAKTIATDHQAVQTAINADPGVVAAKAQLKADDATIIKDEATLQADYTQLAADIKAALS
ncbi:MAG: hypothetical protein P4L84_04890 [Isosphaeraceae bacterium]|nr:hypothetical protein [Isosphaeraceae bacterium]